MPSYKKIFFLLLIITSCTAVSSMAQFEDAHKRNIKYQLIGFALVNSYANDNRITSNTQATMGAGAGFRMELPISRQHTDRDVRFAPGIEIITEGVNFDSYYFAQGYSILYDGNMAYNHSIRMTEICIPLVMRFSFTKKEESLKNYFYCTAGWELKYTLQAKTTITNTADGSQIYSGAISLPYEHQFLGSNEGNDIVVSLGLNHNLFLSKHSVVFDLGYRYGLSRTIYTGNMNSNNVLFRGSNISFGIGLRL